MTRHLLVAVVLVGLALAGGVHYDAVEADHWPYPTADQVSDDPDQYVGEQVILFGTVVSVDPVTETARIEVTSHSGPFTMHIQSFQAPVEIGGVVQVYGTIESDHTLVASSVVIVEETPADRRFKYGVSVLGPLLALAAFFRYWRVEWSTMTFEPR